MLHNVCISQRPSFFLFTRHQSPLSYGSGLHIHRTRLGTKFIAISFLQLWNGKTVQLRALCFWPMKFRAEKLYCRGLRFPVLHDKGNVGSGDEIVSVPEATLPLTRREREREREREGKLSAHAPGMIVGFVTNRYRACMTR